MEELPIVLAPPSAAQHYNAAQWDDKRPVICHLFLDESKTVKQIVQILAEQHCFYVTERMVTFRLGKWKQRKNYTKTAVREHFAPGAQTDRVRIRDRGDMARLISHARQHGVQASSSSDAASGSSGGGGGLDRHLAPPDVYRQRDELFTSIIDYVRGQFDSARWTPEHAPMAIVTDYFNWVSGALPPVCSLLEETSIVTYCYLYKHVSWADILFQTNCASLKVCLLGGDFEAIPVLLCICYSSMMWPPRARDEFLKLCLSLTAPSPELYPIRHIVEQVARMELPKVGSQFCWDFFAQAAMCFAGGVGARLGPSGDMACALLRRTFRVVLPADAEADAAAADARWVDPVGRRRCDPGYFDSALRVECAIVETTEFQGLARLIQLQAALVQQRSESQSAHVRQMLTDRLRSLEVPIRRRACQASLDAGDRNGFLANVHQLTDGLDPAPQAVTTRCVYDTMFAWMLLGECEEEESPELQRVEQRIQAIMEVLDRQMAQASAQQGVLLE